MSGTLIPHSTPWMRDAFRQLDPETKARIEAAIPDGRIVGVSIFKGKPGLYRAWLDGRTTEYGYPSIEAAVRAMLEKVTVAA